MGTMIKMKSHIYENKKLSTTINLASVRHKEKSWKQNYRCHKEQEMYTPQVPLTETRTPQKGWSKK